MNVLVCACGRRYETERFLGITMLPWSLLKTSTHDPDECSRAVLDAPRLRAALEDCAALEESPIARAALRGEL